MVTTENGVPGPCVHQPKNTLLHSFLNLLQEELFIVYPKSFSGRYRILKKGARWLLVKVPPKISLKTEILGHKGGLHAESAPPLNVFVSVK